jgi:SAM-dependent methyltransferase
MLRAARDASAWTAEAHRLGAELTEAGPRPVSYGARLARVPLNSDQGTLLELLACPVCHGSLEERVGGLTCRGCARLYGVRNRVPILFPNASSSGSDERSLLPRLHHSLLARPSVYDVVQKYGGGQTAAEHVGKELQKTAGKFVLDVGAGTGALTAVLPSTTRYVWLDNDTLKLRGLLSRRVECLAVLGDAAQLPFRDSAIDVVVIVDVSHHLPADSLQQFLAAAARVTRDRLIFVDAVRSPRPMSKLLWTFDLGRHPRSAEELVSAIGTCFEVEKLERFRIHHDYLLCVATPRTA